MKTKWLILVLLLATLVRSYGIDQQLPQVYHPDEVTIFHTVIGNFLLDGDLNPHRFDWPHLQMYLTYFEYLGLYLVGFLFRIYPSFQDFVLSFFIDPTPFLLVGRFTSLIAGVLTVLFTYLVGRRVYDAWTGLLAAGFLSFTGFHIIHSQYLTPDVLTTFFVIASLLFILKIFERGELRDYALAGLLAGLAIGTKYFAGALLFIQIFLAHLLLIKRRRLPRAKIVLDRKLIEAGLCMVLAFLATNPFVLVETSHFWETVGSQRMHMKFGHLGFEGTISGWIYHLTHSLFPGLGIPLTVLSIAGILYALFKRSEKGLILLSYPIIYYSIVGSWGTKFARYLIPILPLLLIFGARLVRDILGKVPYLNQRRALASILIGVIVVSPSTIRALSHIHKVRTVPDTRTIAKDWIEKHIPPHSQIVRQLYTPKLRNERFITTLSQHRLFRSNPDLVLRKFSKEMTYKVTLMLWEQRGFYDLQLLKSKGAEYIIISSALYDRHLKAAAQREKEVRFYKELDAQGKLIKEIKADKTQTQGPTIRIYRIGGG